MVLVCAKIASVTFSGAGPPLPMLYLMPKSPWGPPGLWLADRMKAPKAPIARISAESGGGDPDHLLDRLAIVIASVAAQNQSLAGETLDRVECRLDEILDVVRLLEF